tara:strand:+ start:4363 stop:4998 length:636 start_codon:yes stop_codon:yes gene_type:complete
MADLHPRLRERVSDLVIAHEQAFPERALCLIWGHRSTAEQTSAFRAGRSKIDPRSGRFSLHNYHPALAADLWVYIEESATDHTFFEGRPPKALGLRLQLLKRGALRGFYIPMAKLATMVGLEAGALWRTFRDGPHVQLKKQERIEALQCGLNEKGFECGLVDGDFGPKTKGALRLAGIASGGAWSVSWRQRRLMPCSPALWSWLHEKDDNA